MIRKATENDFENAFYFIENLWTYNDYDKDTIRKVYNEVLENEDNFAYFFISDDGSGDESEEEFIGFFHGAFFNTFWMSGQTCYLSSIITDHKYRNQGYAAKMMDHVKVIAKERGCAAIILDSGFPRTDAHSFYEKYGFEKAAYCFELEL